MNNSLTTSERQKAFREKMKAANKTEISVWIDKSSAEKLSKISADKGVTKGDFINHLLVATNR
jgi:hypothetical protein